MASEHKLHLELPFLLIVLVSFDDLVGTDNIIIPKYIMLCRFAVCNTVELGLLVSEQPKKNTIKDFVNRMDKYQERV